MTVMGIPDFVKANNSFNNVGMVEKPLKGDQAKIDQELLNKISGHNPNKDFFKDAKTHNKMGKDEFLKLLTHQLQNQDPTSPMDQKQFAVDLAQFAQLEQLTAMNNNMQKSQTNALNELKSTGASFLGKEILTRGTTLDYKGEGVPAHVNFNLDGNASKVMVRILDLKNNIIGQIEKENMGKGNQTLLWDGKALDGYDAGKGQYQVQVLAWNEQMEKVPVETKVSGIVTGVSFEDGDVVLNVGEKKVFLRDVDSFRLPEQNLQQNLQQNQNIKAYKDNADFASALGGGYQQ